MFILLILLIFCLFLRFLVGFGIFSIWLFSRKLSLLMATVAKVFRQISSFAFDPVFFPKNDWMLFPQLYPLRYRIMLQKGWHLFLIAIFWVWKKLPGFPVFVDWTVKGCLPSVSFSRCRFLLFEIEFLPTKVVSWGLMLSKRTIG